MTTSIFLALVIAGPLVLWVFFLAVMALRTARDGGSIHPAALPLAYVVLGIGLAVDLFVNVTFASLVLLELPRELTVTARVSRHIHDGSGWRQTVSKWICSNLLDPFSTGGHCH